MPTKLDGKALSRRLQTELQADIQLRSSRPPTLAVIIVGNDPASHVYVRLKKKRCLEVGIQSLSFSLNEGVSQEHLIKKIDELNDNPSCDGILVQSPLPSHMDAATVYQSISPEKDVDGFHPENMGKLLIGDPSGFLPCTPMGIHRLLQDYHVAIDGKQLVIVGRSAIVGKPLAALLVQKRKSCNATVTICHSKSERLEEVCQRADILVAAIGKPHFITAAMIKEGATIVDVGINRLADGRLVGDVDFDAVSAKVSHITPVPGGVGPMTIAMLLENTWKSYQKREGLQHAS